MKHSVIIISLILGIGIFAFIFLGFKERGGDSTVTMSALPEVSLLSLENETVLLSDYIGEPMVVSVWATWCPFCRKEIPHFVEVKEEFGDDVRFLLINRKESLDKIVAYQNEISMNGLEILLDDKDAFYRGIGGFAMPETVFVDRNGNIVIHKRGPMSVSEIRNNVSSLVK